MRKGPNSLSLSSQSLKNKLKVSFYLMSILPSLVCVYLVSKYIFPKLNLASDIVTVMLTVIISILTTLVGFFVLKQIFDRIMSAASQAKLIVSGDLTRRLEVEDEDEVGDLSDVINQLTHRIRSNMDEIKSYSDRTTEINIQMQKRVIVLSSLMQISSLISQSANLDDILGLITEKARLLADSDIAYLFMCEDSEGPFHARAVDGAGSEHILKIKIDQNDPLFGKTSLKNKPLILDKKNELTKDITADFFEKFKVRNTLALPIYLRGKIYAILGVGNKREHFYYKKDELELLDIFTKQTAISIENDILMRRVEKLEIKDSLTGVYNKSFIHNRLQEEIKRAIRYQRPCSFILFDIDDFQKFYKDFGLIEVEDVLKKIASLIRDSVSEVDRVGRTGDDEFAVILPEKNKRRAQELAEGIRKKIEFAFSEEADAHKRITVSAGVSENPLDGIETEELLSKAKELVEHAKKSGRNKVEIFK